MPLTTSAAMRALIEGWEGCVLHAYRDAVGILTLGYGHTGKDVHPGQIITQTQADNLLAADLHKFETAVTMMLDFVPTSQQQFDALVSFSYNLGSEALAGSTLLKLHKAGNYHGAAAEFVKWDHAGGRVLPGLVKRREGEARVYLSGDYKAQA